MLLATENQKFVNRHHRQNTMVPLDMRGLPDDCLNGSDNIGVSPSDSITHLQPFIVHARIIPNAFFQKAEKPPFCNTLSLVEIKYLTPFLVPNE